MHADPPEPLGRGRADAGDHCDAHRPEQVLLGARRHDDQPVRLVQVAGDLGHQLRRRDADRAAEAAGHLGDVGLELPRDDGDALDRDVVDVRGREVDEGLVERQRLDQGGQLPQQLHHRAAGRPVGVEPAGEVRRVGAACARLAGRHRRADPEGPGLVGRRRHHAAAADPAHDDRLAAQRRLVALLHGGEERVQVDVEDRRVGAHVPMMPAATRLGGAGQFPSTAAASSGSSTAGGSTGPAGVARREGRCHDRPAHGPRLRPGRPPRPRPRLPRLPPRGLRRADHRRGRPPAVPRPGGPPDGPRRHRGARPPTSPG